MADYIDRDEAIRILTKIMEERKKACGRAPLYEATGLQYAIAVLKQLPAVDPDERD